MLGCAVENTLTSYKLWRALSLSLVAVISYIEPVLKKLLNSEIDNFYGVYSARLWISNNRKKVKKKVHKLTLSIPYRFQARKAHVSIHRSFSQNVMRLPYIRFRTHTNIKHPNPLFKWARISSTRSIHLTISIARILISDGSQCTRLHPIYPLWIAALSNYISYIIQFVAIEKSSNRFVVSTIYRSYCIVGIMFPHCNMGLIPRFWINWKLIWYLRRIDEIRSTTLAKPPLNYYLLNRSGCEATL